MPHLKGLSAELLLVEADPIKAATLVSCISAHHQFVPQAPDVQDGIEVPAAHHQSVSPILQAGQTLARLGARYSRALAACWRRWGKQMLEPCVSALLAIWEQQYIVQRLIEPMGEVSDVGASAAAVDHHLACGGQMSHVV